jgi:plastocyanin
MRAIDPAPVGSHYELLLIGDNGATLSLGDFSVQDGNVVFEGSAEENLLGNYSSATIIIHPDGEEDAAAGQLAFTGLVPPESLLHIRHVVFQYPENPDGKGFLPGAEEQGLIANQHAGLLLESLAADNLDEAKLHAEHVINTLDGEGGESFGDLDGDGQAQNPGDGFGVRAYVEGAKEHAQLAADASGATEEVKLHAGHVIIASDNALIWIDEAIDAALHIISSDSVGEAQPFADELNQLVIDTLNGRDLNGDNYAAPVEGEGTIATAYEHGVFMGGFEIFPGEVTAAPPAAGEPAEEAGEVVIDMLDFSYSQANLTIPAGTTVTWTNVGEVQHSATADDGSFDTGLLDPNGQASVTFDTPGAFPYFCTLHGTAGGVGMAATITVEEAAAAEPAPPEPAAEEVTVTMLDFSYEPIELEVTVGTTVIWDNAGEVQHSATADDGSFDTGVFDPGQQASVTFDTAGTFPYYCTLHGTAGGVGMAGTVVVEP